MALAVGIVRVAQHAGRGGREIVQSSDLLGGSARIVPGGAVLAVSRAEHGGRCLAEKVRH